MMLTRLMRPQPSSLFGTGPGPPLASSSSSAELISAALTSAGDGTALVCVLLENCTNPAAAPAACGPDMLVPPMNTYKSSIAVHAIAASFGAADDAAEAIQLPGATKSGLMRPSAHGPRLEKSHIVSGPSA